MYRKNSSVHVLSVLRWVDFSDKLNGEASKLKRDRAFVFPIPFADLLMYSCDRWQRVECAKRMLRSLSHGCRVELFGVRSLNSAVGRGMLSIASKISKLGL